MTEGEKRDRAPRGRGTADVRRHADRKRRVKESLTELCDLADEIRGRSDQPVEDAIDILRRDTDRIAEFVASVAGRVSAVGAGVDRLLGAGGVLSAVQAVGPIARAILRRAMEFRAEQAAEAELQRQAMEEVGLVDPSLHYEEPQAA